MLNCTCCCYSFVFFFNDPEPPEIYSLSLHDALPFWAVAAEGILMGGVAGPANRHDSPLLVPTLEHACASVGGLPEGASVHLDRSEEHTSELQSRQYLVCRLLLEKKKKNDKKA